MTNTEFKSISSKVSRKDFTLIKDYCRKKGITISSLIRELLLKEIQRVTPFHISGSNKITYNKEKDNYNWYVELDTGEKIEIVKNISVKFLEELNVKISKELEFREHLIKKTKRDSIPVPGSILGA